MASYAVSFDGSNDDIKITDNGFDGLSTGTVEFLMKSAPVSAFQKLVFQNGCIDMGITNNGDSFGEIGGVGNLGIFGSNEDDNNWHHIALTWDGSWLRGYVDGVYKSRTAQGGNQQNLTNDLYLGRRETTEPFGGLMNEFRLSNIARYTTQTSFSVPTTKFTTDANTLILQHLDDGSGTTASDSSGNSNNGTLENGVSWVTPGYFPDTGGGVSDWPIFTGKKFWGPRYS